MKKKKRIGGHMLMLIIHMFSSCMKFNTILLGKIEHTAPLRASLMCVQLWGEKSETWTQVIPPKLVHFVSPKETKINRRKRTPLPFSSSSFLAPF